MREGNATPESVTLEGRSAPITAASNELRASLASDSSGTLASSIPQLAEVELEGRWPWLQGRGGE